ncbi:serine carboxypeptidase-like 26 [Primulina huaijiensis]|uniref:serine carboxypeptidase-like 26 n=1 Tax=Primulina huaijiensis TaxID=1492673 RepID=UPI003CC700D7
MMMVAVESLLPNKIWVVSFGLLFALNVLINASNLESKEYESDRINELPGQPQIPMLSQFSGYITVNEEHGRALFYWFFEAQSQPNVKPLVLWLNGGPGCSSIGYGAAAELGPLRAGKNGAALEFNRYSWNKESNLLFLESPVGVGFSYTNTSSDYTRIDDGFVAEDAYTFLVNWLRRFPQFKDHEFFISGESYAGHYVPQLAELVYDRNKNRNKFPYINLKGFIVGNPETNDYFDNKGILEYAWSHAVISDQDYNEAKRVCNFKNDDWSPECNKAMTVVFNRYKEIDIYNIYSPSCILNKTSSVADDFVQSYKFERMRLPGGYDPCFSTYTAEYFNRKDVQKALRIEYRGLSDSVKWTVCNDSLFRTYNYTVFSVLPIYRKLIKGGLKIWMYSGDADGRVPVIGTRYCIEALGLPLKTPWTSWFHKHQVAGRIVEYEGLTFVTLRGAGHLVPLNKPKQALALIHSYLSGQHLPTRP